MEKLKNMINPGSKKDDEVMYGSGQSDGTGSQSGQGSHFGSSRTAPNDPLSSSGLDSNAGTSGLGNSTRNDPLSSSSHPTSGSSGLGSNTGASGPLSTSTNPTGGSQYDTNNTAARGTHGLNEPYASRMPGGFDDAASTASVRSGIPGNPQTGSRMTGINDPTLTNEPATAGGSSSLTGNLPDRSVGQSGLGNQSTGSSHDAALSAGAGFTQRDNYASESDRAFHLRGNANMASESNYPSGQNTTFGAAGQNTSSPHSSSLANKADPRVDSGPGESTAAGPHFVQGPHVTDTANRLDPHVAGGVGGTESATGHHGHHGHGNTKEDAALGLGGNEGNRDNRGNTGNIGTAPKTAGPHKSDMLNKLDPRVDSDMSKSRGSAETGIGSSTSGTSHHQGNQPTDTASGLDSSNQYSGSGVDPRTGSGTSTLGDTSGTSTGANRDHHLGRDATIGAGAGGLAYEAERHHGKPSQSSHIPSNISGNTYESTRGPAEYDQAGSQLAGSGQQSLTGHGQEHHYGRDAGLGAGAGGLAYEAEKHHNKDQSGLGQQSLTGQGKEHHYGRDAGLGAGAGGLAYEAEKHHHKDHSGVGSTPQDQLAGSGHQSNRDHHLGRDAAVGGAALGVGGAGAAGLNEHQKFRDTGRMDPGTNIREHQHPGASLATYPSPGYGSERDLQQNTSSHGHRKEEEALAGGAAAGGLAHHEHSKHDDKALAKEEKALEKEHSKEVKQHDKALAKEEKAIEKDEKHHEKERAKHMAAIEKDQKKHEHDDEKKHGGLLGFLHKDKHEKNVDQPQTGGQLAHGRRGVDDGMATGAGADSYDQPLEGQYGQQSGVHDSSLGGTGASSIGSGITTHDAYGSHEGHNKLHKDPPAKVLEARGQDYQGHSNVK